MCLLIKKNGYLRRQSFNRKITKFYFTKIFEFITERQKAILALILQKPSYSRDKLAEKTGLSLATIKREITIIRKNGYIDTEVTRMANG